MPNQRKPAGTGLLVAAGAGSEPAAFGLRVRRATRPVHPASWGTRITGRRIPPCGRGYGSPRRCPRPWRRCSPQRRRRGRTLSRPPRRGERGILAAPPRAPRPLSCAPPAPRTPAPSRHQRRSAPGSAYCAVQPPSTSNVVPVTKLEAREARNTAGPIISHTSPKRPCGTLRTTSSYHVSSSMIC